MSGRDVGRCRHEPTRAVAYGSQCWTARPESQHLRPTHTSRDGPPCRAVVRMSALGTRSRLTADIGLVGRHAVSVGCQLRQSTLTADDIDGSCVQSRIPIKSAVESVSIHARQDSERRRARVYPILYARIYVLYMLTILYHYIQTGRRPVPISSELKLKTNS